MQNSPRISIAAALAAVLLLAACNSEPETVVAGGPVDPDAAKVAAAPPVALPPSVTASRTYRCKDNSLVYIDFFNNKTAAYRTTKEGAPTMLTAAEEGKPYTAAGYSISGDGTEISLTAPGKGTTSCKA